MVMAGEQQDEEQSSCPGFLYLGGNLICTSIVMLTTRSSPSLFCGVLPSLNCALDKKGQAFIMGELSIVCGPSAAGLSLAVRLLDNSICSQDKHWGEGQGRTWGAHWNCAMPIYLQQKN